VNITCTSGDTGDIHVRNTELFTNAIDEAITNAIKHTEQPIPEVAITVQRDLGADQFRITIADNGPGVPELERHAINSGEETPLGHSLGIGLWVMKWITTTLGGELIITDNDPQGSVITFQLPVGSSNDEFKPEK